MLYITGDTHGTADILKIELLRNSLMPDDFLLITGDFGVIWRNENDDDPDKKIRENSLIDFYENLGCTILWIDGNHENHVRLINMPITEWHGGKIHKISEHIFHLMRGEIFEIAGYRVFTMGGAASTDKEWRIPGFSWWKEEVPNEEERKYAIEKLEESNWNVDLVITHTAPTSVLRKIGAEYRIDKYTDWLDSIKERLTFNKWFFGHFHTDIMIEETNASDVENKKNTGNISNYGTFFLCFDEVTILEEKLTDKKGEQDNADRNI